MIKAIAGTLWGVAAGLAAGVYIDSLLAVGLIAFIVSYTITTALKSLEER